MNDLVFLEDNRALTSSLKVAELFEKQHKHVLRAIEEAIHSAQNWAEFDNQLFTPSEYDVVLNEEQGITRKAPMYVMTRDGFTLLAMGFTGEKALQFKLRYIQAFNRMEAQLKAVDEVRGSLGARMLERENELLRQQVVMQQQIIDLQSELRGKPRKGALPAPDAAKTQVVLMDEEVQWRQRFTEFADSFFMNLANFGHPVSIREVVVSWMVFLGEQSIPQKLHYEIKNVKKWMIRYCHANGIVVNPEVVMAGKSDKERGVARCTTYESVFYKGVLALPRRRVRKSTSCWFFYRESKVPRERPLNAVLTGSEGLLPEMIVAVKKK